MNYFLYRLKYRFGKYLPLRKPVDIALELSSACNLKCGYCYHAEKDKLPFKVKNMERGVALRILHSAAASGVHSVKFNWRGESTLNPNFFYICSMAKMLANSSTFIDRISNSNFAFNGNNKDIFHGFLCQTKVKISFDSFNKEVYEAQRTGAKFEQVLKNIDTFYNWPYRKTKIVIQAVRTNRNANEDIEGIAKKRWPDVEISIRDMVEGRNNKDLDNVTYKKRDFSERQSCIQAHTRLIFDHNGEAFPCCPDIKNELYLGNINLHSVKDIFNRKNAKELRKSLKNKTAFKEDPCKNCSSFESYKNFSPSWDS